MSNNYNLTNEASKTIHSCEKSAQFVLYSFFFKIPGGGGGGGGVSPRIPPSLALVVSERLQFGRFGSGYKAFFVVEKDIYLILLCVSIEIGKCSGQNPGSCLRGVRFR